MDKETRAGDDCSDAKACGGLDLYSDLVNAADRPDTETLSRLLEQQKAQNVAITEQWQHLAAEAERYRSLSAELTRQNGVLQMNISCLFKTAKVEIDHKDREILKLRSRVELLGRSVAELKVNDEVTRQKLEEALLRLDSLQAAAQFAEATVHSLARHGDGEVSSCDDCPETPARHEMIPSTGRVRHMTESSDWSVCSNFGEGTTPAADPETTPMTTKVADGD